MLSVHELALPSILTSFIEPITLDVVVIRCWIASFQAFMAGPMKLESLVIAIVHTIDRC